MLFILAHLALLFFVSRIILMRTMGEGREKTGGRERREEGKKKGRGREEGGGLWNNYYGVREIRFDDCFRDKIR